MKKFLLMMIFAVMCVFTAQSQSAIQVYGGPTANANFYTLFEYGAVVGAAYKGRYGINAVYRRTYKGQNVYGGGAVVIFNPEDWLHGGLTVNALAYTPANVWDQAKYAAVEVTFDMYWTLNDYTKIKAGVGFIGGLPHIQANVFFGNFKPKYWRRYWIEKKVARMMKSPEQDYVKSKMLQYTK